MTQSRDTAYIQDSEWGGIDDDSSRSAPAQNNKGGWDHDDDWGW
jgi:hypothetical protein